MTKITDRRLNESSHLVTQEELNKVFEETAYCHCNGDCSPPGCWSRMDEG